MRTPGGGDEIHGNFSVIPGNQLTVTELRSYEPGVARVDDPLATPVAAYYHADLIGSTWSMSDENGEGVDAARYSAFGELVEGTAHRYGYAGAYGYQTDADVYGGPGAFPFLHVGARYYDPATGRFLQRDPIGILGGLNVYSYVVSTPTTIVDPQGLQALVPPGHTPVVPAPRPPLSSISDTPLPVNLPPPADLATACNQFNHIWMAQPLITTRKPRRETCNCFKPPYDQPHLHPAPDPPPPSGPCGAGGGSGGGAAGAFIGILVLGFKRRSSERLSRS